MYIFFCKHNKFGNLSHKGCTVRLHINMRHEAIFWRHNKILTLTSLQPKIGKNKPHKQCVAKPNKTERIFFINIITR